MKYIDRGRKNVLVLIPGWATDYRIFDSLELDYNYLVPVDFLPETFEKDLLGALKENNIRKVSLFGWSLGGFVAQEISSKHPELVDELILVSIRKRYRSDELDKIKIYLKQNKKDFLYKFYDQCFHKNDNADFLKKGLFKKYEDEMDLDYLLMTLAYLAGSEIRPDLLRNIRNIRIIHGSCDRISPLKEAIKIKNELPQAKFELIEDAGHIPFLQWIKK